ncbi:VWA domain-containing protein [Paraconexibacter antarcticus]|uniref:VWA domain-containing protein n=1 Tax=Paraconexibacter antarcticus TaxID=2949664 RepID=UPI003F5861F0
MSAVVGQEDLVEALLVCAVHPVVGGVLVRGERGTAKSTAVRALAPMLGDGAPLVELPLGATLDRLVGTLDLRAALSGDHRVDDGLLARADGGVLYVDEVNLLPDHLVDALLDAAASGEVTVERDGVSVVQAARFLLVGTMNPEEGELRPQLLDRFGLGVEIRGPRDPAVRAQIVRRRMDFDADPSSFAARWADAEAALAARIAAARGVVARVRIGERELLRISRVCTELDLDGVRGDLVCAQVARALAALDGVEDVDAAHVERAAHLALRHRMRRDPLAPPPSGGERDPAIEEALEAADEAASEGSGDGGERSEGSGDGGGSNGAETAEGDAGAGEGADAGASEASSAPPTPPACGPVGDMPPRDRTPPSWAPDPDLVPPPAPPAPPAASDGPPPPPRPASVPAAMAARLPEDATHLARGAGPRGTARRGPAGRRAAASDVLPSGRAPGGNLAHLDARPARDGDPIATLPTVLARLRGDDRPQTAITGGGRGALLCLVVDTSGSMAAQRRLARVKGALEAALRRAYARRDLVAVVGFGGDGAATLVAPGMPVEHAAAACRALPAGGRTPLAAGIAHAAELLESLDRDPRANLQGRARVAVLLTDGRAADPDGHARRALVRLREAADRTVVVDLEDGPVRLGLAADLAAAAGADLTRLLTTDPPRRNAA